MATAARIPLAYRALRSGFRYLGPWLPGPASRLAYRLWFATRRFQEPPRETRWRRQARLLPMACNGIEIMSYRWGAAERPAVLLVHGWNGRATQLGAFVEPLLAAGFQVLALDAPAHGRSPGAATTLFDFAAAIRCACAHDAPLAGAIAHSFGVPATLRALQEGLAVPRLVSIAAPAQASFLLERFQTLLDIPEGVITQMRARIEQRFGMDIFTRLSSIEMLRGLQLPGLIIHDRSDRDVPVDHAIGLQAAWPGAQLLLTEGAGHTRILRNPEVITTAVRFLTV